MPLEDRKQRGQRLSLDDANYLFDQARGSPAPVGFSEGGRTYQGVSRQPYGNTTWGKLTGSDLEPWSMVCMGFADVMPADSEKDFRHRVEVLRPPTSSPTPHEKMSSIVYTNRGNKIKSGKWGHFHRIADDVPEVVRVVAEPEGDDPDMRPTRGDPCGVDPSTGFATKRRGGLICVRDGMEVNVGGEAKESIAVLPCPWWWAEGETLARDDTESSDEIRVKLAGGDTERIIYARMIGGGRPKPSPTLTVGVRVDPYTGRFTIVEIVGCYEME